MQVSNFPSGNYDEVGGGIMFHEIFDDELHVLRPDANGHCYRTEQHFESCMRTASQRLLRVEGTALQRWSFWVMLVVVISSFTVLPFVFKPGGSILGLSITLLWTGWFATRTTRMSNRIVAERLCLRCGYPLLHAPVDESGFSRCPECGRRFHEGEYRRPPRRYNRTLANLQAVLRSDADDAPPASK